MQPQITSFIFLLYYFVENLTSPLYFASKLTNIIKVKSYSLTVWRNKALYLQAVNCSATWNKRHDGLDLYHLVTNKTGAKTLKSDEAHDFIFDRRNIAPFKKVTIVNVQALLRLQWNPVNPDTNRATKLWPYQKNSLIRKWLTELLFRNRKNGRVNEVVILARWSYQLGGHKAELHCIWWDRTRERMLAECNGDLTVD